MPSGVYRRTPEQQTGRYIRTAAHRLAVSNGLRKRWADPIRRKEHGDKIHRKRGRADGLRTGDPLLKRKISFALLGTTLEWYEAKLEEQQRHCALCPAGLSNGGRRLAVDHDHTCCKQARGRCGECNRGLLCDRCNQSLERIEELGEEWCQRAIAYLKQYSRVGDAPCPREK